MVSTPNLADAWLSTQLVGDSDFDGLELRDAMTCPAEVLPLLAEDLQAWAWLPDLPLEHQRAMVRDAVLLSRYRYSPFATRRYVSNLGIVARWVFGLTGTRRSSVTVYVSSTYIEGVNRYAWMKEMFGLLFRVPVTDVIVDDSVEMYAKTYTYAVGMIFAPDVHVTIEG